MVEHQLLRNARPEQRFFLPDGTAISNVRELAKKLPALPESVFKHHVSANKNDFHSWVSGVIKDTHLSKEIKEVRDQKKMAALVAKRVRELESREIRQEISMAIDGEQKKLSAKEQGNKMSLGLEMILGGVQKKEAAPERAGENELIKEKSPSKNIGKPEVSRAYIPEDAPPPKKNTALKPMAGSVKKDRPMIEAMAIKKPAPKEVIKIKEKIAPEPKKAVQKKEAIPARKIITSKIKEPIKIPYYERARSRIISAPRPYYAKEAECNHLAHFGCVRCGMVEFGIGLTVGIITTMMFAKAFL